MRVHGMKALGALAVTFLAVTTATAQSPVDPSLQVYQRVDSLKGKITLVGSDTMAQIAAIWGDSFRQLYPDVEIDIQVEGSRDAVTSVIVGEATFGLLSRQITQKEAEAFHRKFGYLPNVLTPALEPIAIFVHKDNPIQGLSLSQLDAIFSTTLKRGEKKTVTTWGELGATGKWANVPVVCQVRSADTGSQVFFQTVIMGGGQFRNDTIENKSNLALVQSIANEPRSIGFAGSIYANANVKAVPLAWRTGEEAIDLNVTGYPLVRPLQLVVNNPAKSALPPLQREFIKYIFSHRGQQDVVIGGFQPIPSKAARIALDAVGESTLN